MIAGRPLVRGHVNFCYQPGVCAHPCHTWTMLAVKLEPTIAPVRGRTQLDRVNFDAQPRRLVTNYSVCDY